MHTHPKTPARSGGAEPKCAPKHTYPHRTTQPGVAGYKRRPRTNTHTPQQPRQEWSGIRFAGAVALILGQEGPTGLTLIAVFPSV